MGIYPAIVGTGEGSIILIALIIVVVGGAVFDRVKRYYRDQ
jgi:hypothetical protein